MATRLQEAVEWGAVCGWHSKVEVERSGGGGVWKWELHMGSEVEAMQRNTGVVEWEAVLV